MYVSMFMFFYFASHFICNCELQSFLYRTIYSCSKVR
ncbi:hypothetical protein Patl1_22597 [Pistacia atlantica]|uniref:Uncharacterized protein n=1 Tax=Pistacia atlantica TaxID=434234 RepID=A0ACC0ZYE2_9ROSI|nr:hypothetical protein Patl1_22597 [Pistacia atlantica]